MLLHYFKHVDGQHSGPTLPDTQGAVSKSMPSQVISAVNTEVALLQHSAAGVKIIIMRGRFAEYGEFAKFIQ